jgi:hypothetical protein
MRISGALLCAELSELTISRINRAAQRLCDAARMHSNQTVSLANHYQHFSATADHNINSSQQRLLNFNLSTMITDASGLPTRAT